MAGEAAVVVGDVTWRGVSVGLVNMRWRHVVRDRMVVMRSEAGDQAGVGMGKWCLLTGVLWF